MLILLPTCKSLANASADRFQWTPVVLCEQERQKGGDAVFGRRILPDAERSRADISLPIHGRTGSSARSQAKTPSAARRGRQRDCSKSCLQAGFRLLGSSGQHLFFVPYFGAPSTLLRRSSRRGPSVSATTRSTTHSGVWTCPPECRQWRPSSTVARPNAAPCTETIDFPARASMPGLPRARPQSSMCRRSRQNHHKPPIDHTIPDRLAVQARRRAWLPALAARATIPQLPLFQP